MGAYILRRLLLIIPTLFGIMVLVLMWRPQGLFGKLGSA